MSLRKTFATSARVLKQLRHDPRSVAMVLFVPVLLITLLKYVFDKEPRVFSSIAPMLIGIFPIMMMFLITSIATLRERKSGTLDRLMTEPMSKLDFIFGYAIAFSLVGFIQACIVIFVTLGLLDVTVLGGTIPMLVTATSAAFLGTSLGLFVSAFARNEFQAVQLIMPLLVPQILLCGIFAPREHMASLLRWFSDIFPLTYSVDAMKQAALNADWTRTLSKDLLIVLGCGIGVLILGSVTIRRQE